MQCGRPEFDPWVGKIPWRRAWQPTPVFLPGESHLQRSLVDCSPWGPKELDTTEWLTTLFSNITTKQWLKNSNNVPFTPLLDSAVQEFSEVVWLGLAQGFSRLWFMCLVLQSRGSMAGLRGFVSKKLALRARWLGLVSGGRPQLLPSSASFQGGLRVSPALHLASRREVWGFPGNSVVKNPPVMQETRVWFLG